MGIQYIFYTEKVAKGEKPEEKIALVETEVVDKNSGETLFKGTVPVTVTPFGVFVSVKAVKEAFSHKKMQAEILFRLKRYVKKMRDYLDVEE
ncbi:hypothetical protein ACFFJY_10325 [Fictibacillus aquaticus]|uniref:Uncharacterized protein n=1 Tax=Fictibacillus aquaticus TaxID=2021314 RepID=A0A235FC97_9BACL|nr:hypothetical protein [Fictibacillus aquaticus]OYD58654.1 hypothetical protein CGZ90_01770 [Fictibacillus aquaticus]